MKKKDRKRLYSKIDKHGPYPSDVACREYPEIKGTRCWPWTGATVVGYGAFRYKGETVYVHRLIWLLEKGPIPEGLDVCHKCDNRKCGRGTHLFTGNRKANMADCVAKDRNNRGSRNGYTHLTENDVIKIRKMYATGNYYQRELAEKFGVTDSLVSMMVSRKIWRHV